MRNLRNRLGLACALSGLASSSLFAADADLAARATNGLGLDLYRQIASEPGNICLSPYSIGSALAMTATGAAGETRAEMRRVLHLSDNEDFAAAFGTLQKRIDESAAKTKDEEGEAITLTIANRLFPQRGYDLRPEFMAEVEELFGAAPERLDFKKDAGGATERINQWVAEQTRDRIKNLIPSPLDSLTRLVLANALYFKAPWVNPFIERATRPAPFRVGGEAAVEVPTMVQKGEFGYARRNGMTMVALPYRGGEFAFLVLLPDKVDGVADVEKNLTGRDLAEAARVPTREVVLHLPQFKFEPPTMALSRALQALGMKSAFDQPPGSANFDRMTPRGAKEYLFISDVFHKTFIEVDEKGTEAAAATAVAMRVTSAPMPKPKPIEVKVDRPFVYAIQHVPSGTCLFMGRIVDPRE